MRRSNGFRHARRFAGLVPPPVPCKTPKKQPNLLRRLDNIGPVTMVDIYKWLKGASSGRTADEADNDRPPGFPAELLPFHAAIEATRLPMIGGRVLDDAPVGRLASRLGGRPWWPAAKAYPSDRKGRPLQLLMQINFAELHRSMACRTKDCCNSSSEPMISMGVRSSIRQNRATLHAPMSPIRAPSRCRIFCFLNGYMTISTPARRSKNRSARSRWSSPPSTMTIDPTDFRFAKLLPEIAGDDDRSELYYEAIRNPPIRIGGYPNFTQSDPREYSQGSNIGTTNLLTVDTTDHIMWGDCGVAQFFIHEKDLRARDFSNVLYNWDCC